MSFSSATAALFGDDDDIYTPDSSFGPEDGATPGGKPKRKSTAGRKLQRWDPEKDQFLLLCVEYYIASSGIRFDWNEVGKLIGPSVTGDAIKQHLIKVRGAREGAKQENPPKIGKDHRALRKNSALVASTKTPRRLQATAKDEENPFVDATPDSKNTGLVFLKVKPTRSQVAKIKAEGDHPPASKKRKAASDATTPSATARGKKRSKTIESSFKTGLETDHLRAHLSMAGNFLSKPVPKTTTSTTQTEKDKNRLRLQPAINYAETGGTAGGGISESPVLLTPPPRAHTRPSAPVAITERRQAFNVYGLPAPDMITPMTMTPAVMTPLSPATLTHGHPTPTGMGLITPPSVTEGHPSPGDMPTPSSAAGNGRDPALTDINLDLINNNVAVINWDDGYGNINEAAPRYGNDLGDSGHGLYDHHEDLYARNGGDSEWLSGDPFGLGGASNLAEHPNMNDFGFPTIHYNAATFTFGGNGSSSKKPAVPMKSPKAPSRFDYNSLMETLAGANVAGHGMDNGASVEGFNPAGPSDAPRKDSFMEEFITAQQMAGLPEGVEELAKVEGDGVAGAVPEPEFDIDFDLYDMVEGKDLGDWKGNLSE